MRSITKMALSRRCGIIAFEWLTAHSIMAYMDHHILRLMHFDNLEHILKHGMYSKNSGHVIPNYVNIGDTTLIKQKETFTVRIDPPNGNLGD